MPEKNQRLLLPAVVFLVLAAVGFDFSRRTMTGSAAVSDGRTATVHAEASDSTRRSSLGGRAVTDRREQSRERLRAESSRTFLNAMLLDTDSMLRRWPDERLRRPLRVAIVRPVGQVQGFVETFVGNVAWAMSRWNASMPVQMQSGADSLDADIVIRWITQLDSNRTGRTDLTWDSRGHVRYAVVHLATHTPEGILLDNRQMTALALHEIGHAVGLGHSPEAGDALFPVTRAIDLTERDRRSVYVLYDLPPGSVR